MGEKYLHLFSFAARSEVFRCRGKVIPPYNQYSPEVEFTPNRIKEILRKYITYPDSPIIAILKQVRAVSREWHQLSNTLQLTRQVRRDGRLADNLTAQVGGRIPLPQGDVCRVAVEG